MTFLIFNINIQIFFNDYESYKFYTRSKCANYAKFFAFYFMIFYYDS